MRTKPLKVSKINQLTVKASFLCFCWYTKNLFQFSCNLSQDGKGFLYSWFAFLKQMCWMQPCTSYILSLLMIYQFMCIAYCCQNYTRLVWIILSIIHLVCRLIQSEATSTRKKLKNFWEAAECEHHWTAIQQDFVLVMKCKSSVNWKVLLSFNFSKHAHKVVSTVPFIVSTFVIFKP